MNLVKNHGFDDFYARTIDGTNDAQDKDFPVFGNDARYHERVERAAQFAPVFEDLKPSVSEQSHPRRSEPAPLRGALNIINKVS